MRLFEKLRYYSFWIIDFLTGSKVRFHYRDIRFILEHYNSEKSKEKRDFYLQNILKHAVNTTPFYGEYKNYNTLSDFPVVDKVFIREHFDQFLSKEYKDKKGYKIQTSGSTGTPFTVYLDKNKKARNTANTFYFSEKGGYDIGQKLFYIRAWNTKISKSKITSFVQNIRKINVVDLDNETIPKFIEEIKAVKSGCAILGYTSSIREVCKYLDSIDSKPIDAKVTSVIANAEALEEYTKNAVKKYFNCEALSRYSNMENGILSQQLANEGDSFHINWASFYIEILNLDNDSPVQYGERGRVVVTDLFNYHVPMIRYDTGDIAIMNIDKTHFNGAPSFFNVEGRKMDAIYTTKGQVITSVVYELEDYEEIKQYQLIQEHKNTYRVILNLDGVFKHEEGVISMLKEYLGQDAIIDIEYVNEIPQLSSGKRKLTINEFSD